MKLPVYLDHNATTPVDERVLARMLSFFTEQYGEDHVVSDLALNRLTEPTDLAPLVVLLASGLADHATGATIDVNAGSYVH
jgi:3-oxoacyl-[acyl-carrier protein] reductase